MTVCLSGKSILGNFGIWWYKYMKLLCKISDSKLNSEMDIKSSESSSFIYLSITWIFHPKSSSYISWIQILSGNCSRRNNQYKDLQSWITTNFQCQIPNAIMWYGKYTFQFCLVYIRRCKYLLCTYVDESLGQKAVVFTSVNKCYFCLGQQFSDAFCIYYTRDLLGLITSFWGDRVEALYGNQATKLTRHAVSLNTQCLISSCTPPRSVTLRT